MDPLCEWPAMVTECVLVKLMMMWLRRDLYRIWRIGLFVFWNLKDGEGLAKYSQDGVVVVDGIGGREC
jgi:hypothetical protein